MTVLPTITVCVFLLMAAPYMQRIVSRLAQGPKKEVVRSVTTSDEPAPPPAVVQPPINPELADSLFYQKLYDEQGFDWRSKPVLEIPEEEKGDLEKIEIEPVPVEIPVVMSQSTAEKLLVSE